MKDKNKKRHYNLKLIVVGIVSLIISWTSFYFDFCNFITGMTGVIFMFVVLIELFMFLNWIMSIIIKSIKNKKIRLWLKANKIHILTTLGILICAFVSKYRLENEDANLDKLIEITWIMNALSMTVYSISYVINKKYQKLKVVRNFCNKHKMFNLIENEDTKESTELLLQLSVSNRAYIVILIIFGIMLNASNSYIYYLGYHYTMTTFMINIAFILASNGLMSLMLDLFFDEYKQEDSKTDRIIDRAYNAIGQYESEADEAMENAALKLIKMNVKINRAMKKVSGKANMSKEACEDETSKGQPVEDGEERKAKD